MLVALAAGSAAELPAIDGQGRGVADDTVRVGHKTAQHGRHHIPPKYDSNPSY
jgi:hypothetical protein